MTESIRPRMRHFESATGQQHITAADHYIYARRDPEYTINVIGTGTIGTEHMRVAALHGRARVGAIWDPAPQSMAAAIEMFAGRQPDLPRQHDTLEAACNDADADALFICSPNHTHLDVLRTAMASGKPIFLEKPMATTVADAAEIVRLADGYDSFIQIGLQYRYKAQYREAGFEVFERDSIGPLHMIEISEYRPPFLDKVGQWNKFNRFSGGTLVEKCCHYFDLMNGFAQSRAARVYASGGQAVNFRDFDYDGSPSDIDDHSLVIVDYASGLRGSFSLNMAAPSFREDLVLSGNRGVLRASERFDFLHGAGESCKLEIERHEPSTRRLVDIGYPAVIEKSGHHGATYFEHMAFSDRLAGIASHAATPRDGLWSVVVASAAQQSIASGAPVIIDTLIEQEGLQDLCGD
ncbi:MAG: Gfo/Idh/MocA family oxidoreductase [Pseudomonadota bacterium]